MGKRKGAAAESAHPAQPASKKRAAPDGADYTAAKHKEEADWKFPKKDWKTKGALHYAKLKQQVAKSRKLTAFDTYLWEVHFPRTATPGHECAVPPSPAKKKPAGKRNDDAVFGDGASQVIGLYDNVCHLSIDS
jgi:hypothetical protein